MIQYLINCTAIWLISLVVFDLFLRRESYHTYNRFFLLVTFLLGLLLPALQWQSYEYLQPVLRHPVEDVINAKNAIVSSAATSGDIDWDKWLVVMYICGAAVAVILLGIDIVKLAGYYAVGIKSQHNGWTIIETGRAHAPFSFRKLLFVNTRAQYSSNEWDMILIHEGEHTRLLHVVDICLIQLARVVFWFHPLVYVYNKRILMVHEFQADNVPSVKPVIYGQFLVEQALLGTAPQLSHSFNRSPIKKRIIMLTHRSTKASRTKMLVVIPIALVSVFCFSQNGFAQKFERKGNMVTYNGNKFEFSKEQRDTVEMQDPVTGETKTKVVIIDAQPRAMNGKPFPSDLSFSDRPVFVGTNNNIRTYLLNRVKSQLQQLDNGQYKLDISNMVIDEKGKVVYFDYTDMRRSKLVTSTEKYPAANSPKKEVVRDPGVKISLAGSDRQFSLVTTDAGTTEIDKKDQQRVFQQVCKVLNDAKVYRPAIKDGKPVICVIKPMEFFSHFKVENHRLYDIDKNGNWVEI